MGKYDLCMLVLLDFTQRNVSTVVHSLWYAQYTTEYHTSV